MKKKRIDGLTVYSFSCLYAGQDPEFRTVPSGYVNKTVCGCGLTSVAIENGEDCVIAMPNVELVRNKVSQYRNQQQSVQGNPMEGARRRFDGEVLGVYSEVGTRDVDEYVKRVRMAGTPVKILVTYDSLWKVEHLIRKDSDTGSRWMYSSCCRLIVDESNRLLSYMPMKVEGRSADSHMDVITHLYEVARQSKRTVSFISATPVRKEYMPQFISELEQVELRWEQGHRVVPICMKRTNPYTALEDEIIRPLKRDGEVKLADRVARKVIVFVNSVRTIGKILKECMLESEEVAIVCGDTSINSYKTRGYRQLTDPCSLPRFTFITSTGFQGIDLVDSEAMSIVVSCTDRNHYMVDLSTDLMQAISRQRDRQNPNNDRFVYIYNQCPFTEKTERQLIEEMDMLHDRIEDNCENLRKIGRGTRNYRSEALTLSQSSDFRRYTYRLDRDADYQVNEALFQTEKYFILEIRRRYTQGFDIPREYGEEKGVEPICIPQPQASSSLSYSTLLLKYQSMVESMEGGETNDRGNIKADLSRFTPEELSSENFSIIDGYYSYYGRFTTNSTYARRMTEAVGNHSQQFMTHIRQLFHKGYYTMKEVKRLLNQAYSQYGMTRKAKDNDLQEFGYKTRITMPKRRKHVWIVETPLGEME